MLGVWSEVAKVPDRDTELKPCPFCGREAKIAGYASCNDWHVECPYCHIGTQVCAFDNLDEVISVWNARVSEVE